MRSLDIAVIIAYFAAVIAVGLLLAGRQRDASDYFLGHRGLPWWALMFSVVATETSALTVISVPGLAARGNLTFLQIAFGYLVGRIGVATLLLPGYFEGTQDTAYQRLEHRFGQAARRTASGVFLFTRALADCVRIFATAIPLAIITHWSLTAGIIAIGFVTLVYTWVGGLRAVVWVDVIQLGVYLLGGIATLIVATHLAGGVAAFSRAWDTGKLTAFDFGLSFTKTYTFWGGVIGGALLSAASHGTDHLIVQRLLAARNLKDAQRALVGSGVFIILQFALFLLVGTSLWLAGADHPGMRGDALYPTFVITQLPAGLAGLVVAGILAAAMSSHASAVNSLASASTHDFYAPLTGRQDPARLLWVGRWLTLLWTAVLVAGAMAFRNQNTPVVQLALSIASVTYGSLLGTYVLGGLWARARPAPGAPLPRAVTGRADPALRGRADGPPASMKPGGAAASAAVLGETARRAATQAGIDLPAERAVVAAAGAGRTQERAELEAALIHAGLARHVRVMADGEVALSTAFPDGTGILVNAGTGSIAYARDPGGQVHRVGGYGWQLGDEGGGYWLGRRALDGAARAQDGRGEGSTLLARLLGALGLQTFDDLVRWTATATPAQVAALAPHVLNAAGDGEVVAQCAVEDAARELVALVVALERHYPGTAPVSVAMAGGLLVAHSPLADAFRTRLAAQSKRARLVNTPVDTPVRALPLARRMT